MAFYLYEKTPEGKGFRYRHIRKVPLAGSRSGLIAQLLRRKELPWGREPFPWHLPMAQELENLGWKNHAILIELKPYSATPNLSLYELQDVFGYSYSGWTPLVFHLRGLFIDQDPNIVDPKDFLYESDRFDPQQRHKHIFTFPYLQGGVYEGKIEGKWIFPRPSSTNTALLWPEAMSYFIAQIQKVLDNR